MAKNKIPMTPALRMLKQKKVDYTVHMYDYVEKGGTKVSADAVGVDEHQVIKTLVMEDESKNPLIILMHGDCEVSTKNLARQVGVKSISPCKPEIAQKHTGYQTGGTSPFGTKKSLSVYCESSILELDKIIINGGKRGLLVEVASSVLVELLNCESVEAKA